MNLAGIQALLPLILTAYGGAVLMTLTAFVRSRRFAFGFTVAVLIAAFVSIFFTPKQWPVTPTPLIVIDAYSRYFAGLILISSILVTLLCQRYVQSGMGRDYKSRPIPGGRGAPLYVLVLFATAGMITIAASVHFVSFFLGLETLSISLYGLIGYTRRRKQSLEGAIKYLVLAATASAFLLFGMALIYAETGTMHFGSIALPLASGHGSLAAYLGMVLVVVAIGFKLAFVPFHMWSPDVYQGAPAPITALISTGSKGAVLALLLRLVYTTGLGARPSLFLILAVLSVATMTVGNLLALLQSNVKRLLAYSSIAHMGYLIIPLLAGPPIGPSSIAFYLASYFATNIAAFGVISALSIPPGMIPGGMESGDLEELDDYRGLAHRNPLLAATFALALLSLTGIPLTSGFFAKLYIFSAAAQSGLWTLLIIAVINSGISAFYYLRVLIAMYTRTDADLPPFPAPGAAASIALGFPVAVIVFFGVYPSPLVRLAEAATRLIAP